MTGDGYVNRGTDPRLDGPLGRVLGAVQRALSFRATASPRVATIPFRQGGHVAVAWPPFVSVFVARGDGRYRSVRVGWRYDPNVGDGQNALEPPHDPAGAYIADVIVKTDIDHVVDP